MNDTRDRQVAMDRKTADRYYSAPVAEVFEAALHALVELGFSVVHADDEAHTIVFDATGSRSSNGQRFTLFIGAERSAVHVVVHGGGRGTALATRGRLADWSTPEVPTRVLEALTRVLSAPPAGWFDDPSRRFAKRWWDGTVWTKWARDDPRGPRFEDAPEPHHAPPG